MVDIDAVIRTHLVSQSNITAVFGKRIYMARMLPPGYRVEHGPALLGMVRGGSQGFHSQLFYQSVQFRIYAKDEAACRGAFIALYDALNDTVARGIAYIRQDDGTSHVLLTEPETNWPYILCYFRFQLHNLGG